jgi:hypothetical protein
LSSYRGFGVYTRHCELGKAQVQPCDQPCDHRNQSLPTVLQSLAS